MRSLDLSADDLAKAPWSYPGTPAARSGLLVEGRYLRLQPSAARAAVDHRSWVVATGSNMSPAVVWRKLSRAGVSTVVPFLMGTASGLAVGHSAHISRYGYVPAAPFHEPGAAAPVVASLLDTSQLRALDQTEPNYRRVRLSGRQVDLQLEGGERPEACWIYVSRRGLLKGPDAGPLRMTTQPDVFVHLRAFSRALGTYATEARLEPLMRRLSRDARQRERLSEAFAAENLVVGSGLPGDQR